MEKLYQKKYWMIALLVLLLCIGKNVNAEESQIFYSDVIPEMMQPYTEIEFQSENTYRIIQGGALTEEDIQKNQLQQEEEFSEALQFEAECKENGSDQTAISESYPLPQKGMKVIYASDGFVLDIVDEEGENVSSQLDIASMNLNNTATASTNATKVLIASWGANNNRLYRKTLDDGTTKIVGFGRATTFADKTGQRDHTLEKGDVATKRDYDNCKYGIEVKVKTKKNGTDTVLTKSMKKCDVGSMPDAIVDIWKTGVSYWGYTYSSSFSMPDEVKIVHADSY